MKMRMTSRAIGRALLQRAARIAAALAMSAGIAAAHAAIIFDPFLPGQFAVGSGANATFVRFDGAWTGTSVYWKQPEGSAPGQFSNTPGPGFELIGSYSWGTGIWGLADWAAINAAGSSLPLQTWSGQVATIDHADAEYAAAGYVGWGAVGALPAALFDGASGPQDNWTSHYSGYLRITDPGAYNFGVLYDDGFFLRIWGAGDAMLEISSDFLSPRERLGFASDLLLGTGLYRFELGAYDRLEVGVVNLAWWQGGAWQTVPSAHLLTEPIAIPEPGTASLLLAALLVAAFGARRKRP
jgi:hypothetical protein